MIVISSELPELLGVCDRIYTLAFGRITGVVPVKEATPESLMRLMTLEPKRSSTKEPAKAGAGKGMK